jgi:flavodoxin
VKKFIKQMFYIFIGLAIIWTILTIWADAKGKAKQRVYGNNSAAKKVLIVYDPDPIYNLDEQVCRAFADGLTGMYVTVATVAAAEKINDQNFDVYVFCANTYNWRPDKAVSNFIENNLKLNHKPVVAVTLGSGSTEASQKKLEEMILKKGARLIGSRTYWLLKPNDEKRPKEKNVDVAIDMARKFAAEIIVKLKAEKE